MLDETAYLEDFTRTQDGYFFLVEEFRRELPEKHAQLRAQSNSMARQADSAMRSLLKLQAAREKRDADAKRADAAVWAEHRAAKGMEAGAIFETESRSAMV